MDFNQRLLDLGFNLPTLPKALGNYVGYQIAGNLVYISGQLPMVEGKVAVSGKVGDTVSLEEAQQAAKLCAINIITQVKAACNGDLNKVAGCIRLGGFVNSTDGYTDQPQVINGASDFMVEVFGEAGRHARAAVGVNALPLGAAVEIEALFILKD